MNMFLSILPFDALSASIIANVRMMRLMSRTIYQQVILREAGLTQRPASHVVELADMESLSRMRRKVRLDF